jgi:hypothetical protein
VSPRRRNRRGSRGRRQNRYLDLLGSWWRHRFRRLPVTRFRSTRCRCKTRCRFRRSDLRFRPCVGVRITGGRAEHQQQQAASKPHRRDSPQVSGESSTPDQFPRSSGSVRSVLRNGTVSDDRPTRHTRQIHCHRYILPSRGNRAGTRLVAAVDGGRQQGLKTGALLSGGQGTLPRAGPLAMPW